MSIREFPAVCAAGRVALVSAVLFAFGAVAGCSSTTVSGEYVERGIARPGEDAAAVSEARAMDIRDEINRLQEQQDELDQKRTDCMKQADSYRAKSAGVWSDPSVSEGERAALADQYSTLAVENEARAFRYGQISDACASRISLLESERRDQLRRAEHYESAGIPSSASE